MDTIERLAAALRAEMEREPPGPGRIALEEVHECMLAEARGRADLVRAPPLDLRALFVRFMRHIEAEEGVYYVPAFPCEHLTAKDIEVLNSLTAEAARG